MDTLKVTYLSRGSVGNFYRYRSKEILNVLKDSLPKKENFVILDLSCGAGWYLRKLEKYGFAIGVDICKEYLSVAKLWCRCSNLVLADACNLPFKDSSVNFVLCSELIEHLVNPDECLKEVARVLRRQGLMLITTPMRYSIMEIFGRKNYRHNIEHINVLTYRHFCSKVSSKFQIIFEKAILFIPLTIIISLSFYT